MRRRKSKRLFPCGAVVRGGSCVRLFGHPGRCRPRSGHPRFSWLPVPKDRVEPRAPFAGGDVERQDVSQATGYQARRSCEVLDKGRRSLLSSPTWNV